MVRRSYSDYGLAVRFTGRRSSPRNGLGGFKGGCNQVCSSYTEAARAPSHSDPEQRDRRGDIVADFFGGAGSTMMTCEQLDRSCRTMELDPVFCDVIKLRYQAATGTEPLLLPRADPVA